MLLSGILQRSESNVLASDEVLHIFLGIGLLLRGEMMIEVDLLDLGLFLLGLHPFLELLVGDDDPPIVLLRPRVLLLDFLN
jgi:hypothetical protein